MRPTPSLMPTRRNPDLRPAPVGVERDPFCFVCRRVTDHFAEHDDLVSAGIARYQPNGSVVLIASHEPGVEDWLPRVYEVG